MSAIEPTDEMVEAAARALGGEKFWERAVNDARAALRAALAASSPSAPTEDDREWFEGFYASHLPMREVTGVGVPCECGNSTGESYAGHLARVFALARRSPVAPSEDVATRLTGSGDVASSGPILYTSSEDITKLLTEAQESVRAAVSMLHQFGWPTLADELLVKTDPVFAALRSGAAVPVEAGAFVIESELYRTDDGHEPLPSRIGPFPSREAAEAWLESRLPLWGEHEIHSLFRPDREEQQHG